MIYNTVDREQILLNNPGQVLTRAQQRLDHAVDCPVLELRESRLLQFGGSDSLFSRFEQVSNEGYSSFVPVCLS